MKLQVQEKPQENSKWRLEVVVAVPVCPQVPSVHCEFVVPIRVEPGHAKTFEAGIAFHHHVSHVVIVDVRSRVLAFVGHPQLAPLVLTFFIVPGRPQRGFFPGAYRINRPGAGQLGPSDLRKTGGGFAAQEEACMADRTCGNRCPFARP